MPSSPAAPNTSFAELASIEVTTFLFKETVLAGKASSIMGDPVTAIVRLATELAVRGCQLEPNDVVASGSFTTILQVHTGSASGRRLRVRLLVTHSCWTNHASATQAIWSRSGRRGQSVKQSPRSDRAIVSSRPTSFTQNSPPRAAFDQSRNRRCEYSSLADRHHQTATIVCRANPRDGRSFSSSCSYCPRKGSRRHSYMPVEGNAEGACRSITDALGNFRNGDIRVD